MQPKTTTALLLIAHGSRNSGANLDLVEMAEALRIEGHQTVEHCYLEIAEPSIQAGGLSCVMPGITTILMLPYFLSAGIHMQRDLEQAKVTLERQFPGVQFVLAKPLGPHSMLLELLKWRGSEALNSVNYRSSPPVNE